MLYPNWNFQLGDCYDESDERPIWTSEFVIAPRFRCTQGMSHLPTAQEIRQDWKTNRRWAGIERPYTAEDVVRLRGTVPIEYSLASLGAQGFWELVNSEPYVHALGALTGNQAVQQVQAGLKAIYLSGWQVAGDANLAGQMYPDQSLYPCNSVPTLVRALNNAMLRADQIACSEEQPCTNAVAPIVADAEAGFGGPLNAFELMKAMIEAGASGVHFEDQLASAKKCGHMGGKVLVPTQEFITKLISARLAADTMGVSTVLIARTDADSARLLTSATDSRDLQFLTGKTTPEGLENFSGGIEAAIARGRAYAPYADMLWCETSEPDLPQAQRFADGVHDLYPGKLLAYNCSPSFHWKRKLDTATIARFQRELGAMGYRFQFVTLAGFHALNMSMFELAREYAQSGMAAYSRLQEKEFESQDRFGYAAVKHQRFVGTGYFDALQQTITSGAASTLALVGSTEEEQFV